MISPGGSGTTSSSPWMGCPDRRTTRSSARSDGEVVGYVTPHQQELVVHPDFRRQGIGTRLVEAGLAYARTQDQAALTLAPPPGNSGAEAFATRLGFTYDSSLWQLRLPPDREIDRPVFPPTVVARPFTADVDLGRYVGMINSAFVDHPSPMMVTIDVVRMAHARTRLCSRQYLPARRGRRS